MLKVALNGASGLVGSRIVELLQNNFQFIDLPQSQMDITNSEQVNQVVSKTDFDIFLHLAAYTNVDAAEINQRLAYKINVEGTRNIFQAVTQKNKKFIYISTGFVFDGENPPYDESSQPHPLSTYAKTKWQGEEVVRSRSMIVRIEYPYRAKYDLKKDLLQTIRSLIGNNKTVYAVTDSIITPTFIDDIAFGLKYLLENHSPEIFHLVGADSLSPYDACKTIADVFNLNKNLIQPTTSEIYFKGNAIRPKNAIIKSIKNHFYKMKTFKQGLT